MSVNKWLGVGNLTRDPQVRYTPSGTAVADVGIAVNDNWTDKQGKKRESVDFFDLVFWGRQAEVLAEYCQKGSKLFVEGKLKFEQWEDKDSGQKRSRTKVHVQSMEFLSWEGRQKGDNQQRQSNQQSGSQDNVGGFYDALPDDCHF